MSWAWRSIIDLHKWCFQEFGPIVLCFWEEFVPNCHLCKCFACTLIKQQPQRMSQSKPRTCIHVQGQIEWSISALRNSKNWSETADFTRANAIRSSQVTLTRWHCSFFPCYSTISRSELTSQLKMGMCLLFVKSVTLGWHIDGFPSQLWWMGILFENVQIALWGSL